MSRQSHPQHGRIIVFSKIPTGSYCLPGVAYRVDRPKGRGDFRFVNVARGSATFDRPWALDAAEWALAQLPAA